MPSVHETLSEQFYRWEQRGRGWQVFDHPVAPEPPFVPFAFTPQEPAVDDGRRPTILSSLFQKFSRKLSGEPEAPSVIHEPEEEPEPELLQRDSLVELQTFLPANLSVRREEFAQFLSALSLCCEPVAFELLGTSTSIIAQFAVHRADEALVHRQLRAFFPDAVFLSRLETLQEAWTTTADSETAIVEFGLAREFMFPLASGRLDPFVGLTGALSELEPQDLGLFQVIFAGARCPWSESIMRSVADDDDKPFFVNAPQLLYSAKEKVSRPLYAAVVRIAAKSPDVDRAWEIARGMAGALAVFARPDGNELIPLRNDDYPLANHAEDVIRRQSRRTGMLLNSDELIGFVHLPSVEVRSPKLARQTLKTKPAPQTLRTARGLVLGENIHAGVRSPVALTPEQRVRHVHVIGASGTGKSTLFFNLIRQDIEQGQGVALLDPHGDLVDQLLGVIPRQRIEDVVLLDPSDEKYSIGFNILSAHSELEKNLLASDLVSVFQRLSGSWGDQMASVLSNAILAFLESSQGGTLADLRRFLLEPDFRQKFLEGVRDPEVVYYWRKGFTQLAGNKSIGPVLTRLETFLSRKPIRYMVSQKENRLDFADILDTGKIFLAKLSQGTIGRENSYLLGAVLVSKFQQMAMSRQQQTASARRDFWLYIDEFHNFITPSMAEILSGARKYRVGLILAHQELRHLQRDSEVASAVMSNPGTRICFRVGDDDARKLADGFSFFEARDLQNLGKGEAICRVERSDFDFNLTVPLPALPPEAEADLKRQEVITASRNKYATPRAEVERVLYREPHLDDIRPVARSAATAPKAPEPRAQPVAEPAKVEKPLPPSLDLQPQTSSERVAGQPPTPAAMGRGGAQHQAIQRRIKAAAEALGFHSVIEHQILAGQGSVDLLLKRQDRTIACEISITTTVDHEVGNVVKCLRAGFEPVAVICLDEERLQKIAAAVAGSLGADAAAKVEYYLPDQFIASLAAGAPVLPKAEEPSNRRRGYRVRRSVSKQSPDEQKQREDAGIRSIAELLRKKHPRP
jgi:hypothetical protein